MTATSGYAPGRVELLGNHTDYNQGVVLAAAIDRGLTVSGASRSDGVINFASTLRNSQIRTSLSDLRPRTEEEWANYPLGVVYELVRSGHALHGFDAVVSGDIPVGAGLSSSAAFEVATACFLMSLYHLRLEPLEVAKLCRKAENEFVGVQSGLLDQMTSVFGRENHAVFLDCKTEEVRAIPFPLDLALVIAESDSKHDLLQGKYNQRREECAAAAGALGVSSLREVSAGQLAQSRSLLDPTLYRRAAHIIGENERVFAALELLEAGDAGAFGFLMNASHESSRTNFENSTDKLDRLVDLARSLPGVLGSRLTGGGFGGATVTLAEISCAAGVAAELSRHSISAFICRTANGAAMTWPR